MAKGSPYGHADAVRRGLVQGSYRIPVNHLISCVAAGAGVGIGSKILDTFPKGRVTIQSISANIKFTARDANLIATWSANWGLGTGADADGTLATTDQDLIAVTAIGPAVAGVIAGSRLVNTTAQVVNNDAGTVRVNLNLAPAAASITDATTAVVLAQGFIEFILGTLRNG
jgi:hypothetical protein